MSNNLSGYQPKDPTPVRPSSTNKIEEKDFNHFRFVKTVMSKDYIELYIDYDTICGFKRIFMSTEQCDEYLSKNKELFFNFERHIQERVSAETYNIVKELIVFLTKMV